MIFRLIYSSQSTPAFLENDLTQILESSRRNNIRDGITGLLVYGDGSFLQVLEGAEGTVKDCYARIEENPKHTRHKILHTQHVSRRAFANWAMGYQTTAEMPQLKELVGEATSANALQADHCGTPLVVRKFIRAFADLHLA